MHTIVSTGTLYGSLYRLIDLIDGGSTSRVSTCGSTTGTFHVGHIGDMSPGILTDSGHSSDDGHGNVLGEFFM